MTNNVVPVTLAEILSSLSVALDLVEGQPQGHAVRTCLLAMRIGEQLGLSEHDRTRLYFASILKDAGCSNNAARVHKVFGGDEHLVKHDVKLVDWSDPVVSLKFALGHTEVGGSIGRKLRRMLGNLAPPAKIMDEVTMARCSRGAEIARSLGFDEDVASAVRDLDEHWDGGGSPRHKRGEEIPMLARLVGLAQTLEVFAAALGRDAALDMVRDRSGRWFDPETCEAVLSLKDDPIWKRHAAFLEEGTSLLPVPEAAQQASPADIDRVCQAFAQIVDAKSAHTGEHSSRVTDYAVTLGADFGLDRSRLLELKRAALLHDIGKLGVPNGILDKPGRLTTTSSAGSSCTPCTRSASCIASEASNGWPKSRRRTTNGSMAGAIGGFWMPGDWTWKCAFWPPPTSSMPSAPAAPTVTRCRSRRRWRSCAKMPEPT